MPIVATESNRPARPNKKKGGRVTEKKSAKKIATPVAAPSDTPSSRHTPKKPVVIKQTPIWVPILMFSLWIIGALILVLNYLPDVLPGGESNRYLFIGLGSITGGFLVATRFH